MNRISFQTDDDLKKLTNLNHTELIETFAEQIEAEINYSRTSIEINLNTPLFIQLKRISRKR
jgi:hypothetical protein